MYITGKKSKAISYKPNILEISINKLIKKMKLMNTLKNKRSC